MGGSGPKNCAEHHGNVRFCVAPQKPTQNFKKHNFFRFRIFSKKNRPFCSPEKKIGQLSKIQLKHKFFAIFDRFLRSYAKTDVTMTLSAKFRSRSTYYQLCTTLGASEHVPNTSGRRAKRFYKTK